MIGLGSLVRVTIDRQLTIQKNLMRGFSDQRFHDIEIQKKCIKSRCIIILREFSGSLKCRWLFLIPVNLNVE